jgi:PAS domain S-box-containing protein
MKMPGERPLRILHVDDEENQLEFTKIFLEQIDKDVKIDSVLTPAEALKLHEQGIYDCIVSDYKMMTMNGIELAQKIREKSSVPFILYTGQGSEEVAEKAFNAGVDDYLRKEAEPTHYQVLAKRIRLSVEKHRIDELYKKVVEESREAIVILKDNKIQFLNQSACKLVGIEDKDNCIGQEIFEFMVVEPEQLAPPKDMTSRIFEANYRTKSGLEKAAEVTLSKITYLGEEASLAFIRDITKKKRSAERLDAIYQQAVRLSSTNTIQEISETTLDIIETLFSYHTITFHFLENDILRTMGMRGTQYLDLDIPLLGRGIIAKAAREQKSILVPDTAKTTDFLRGVTSSKSELAVPAVLDDETIAVLNVESDDLNDFTDEDRKLLETLSYHVSFAFNRIKQREEEERLKEEKRKKLDYALGRLDHAEKVNMLVREELQKNILSILNASLILREKPSMVGRITKAIDVNAGNAQIVSEQIRDSIAGNALEAGFIEVNQTVRQVLDKTFTPKNIRIMTQYDESLLIIEIEEDNFNRMLRNLINNAIEAMPGGGTMSIKVTSKETEVIIDVKDTGSGINEQAMTKIFQPFNTTKVGHSGLGLAFCKNALEAAGGSLEIKATGDKGTTLNVKLPLRRKL